MKGILVPFSGTHTLVVRTAEAFNRLVLSPDVYCGTTAHTSRTLLERVWTNYQVYWWVMWTHLALEPPVDQAELAERVLWWFIWGSGDFKSVFSPWQKQKKMSPEQHCSFNWRNTFRALRSILILSADYASSSPVNRHFCKWSTHREIRFLHKYCTMRNYLIT